MREPRLLSLKQVLELTSLTRANVYRLMARGQFPKPKRISPGRVAWPANRLEEWQKSIPDAEYRQVACKDNG